MPDNFTPFLEKGFFAALGLIGTGILTAIGIKSKADNQFKRDTFKRMNALEKDMNAKHAHILENYPSKDDFNTLAEIMRDGFKEVRSDIKKK